MTTNTLARVYPPYQLNTFQECPMKWWLGKRWEQKVEEQNKNSALSMLVGEAVAAGLEKHFLQDGDSTNEEIREAISKHCGTTEPQKVARLAMKGVDLGCGTLLPLKETLLVEQFIGRVKPDLVGRDFGGRIVVIDHKVKLNLDERYFEKELRRYNTSNQFMHYAWVVSQEYGEPVDTVYAHIIILGPIAQTVIHPVDTSEERISHWYKGASADWIRMQATEAGGQTDTRYTSCETPYGPCHFWDGCHILHGDESKFEALYERKNR